MSALSVAGMLIATQTGLAYAQLLDPTKGDPNRWWATSCRCWAA